MPFGHILGVLPPAVLALHVVVVVGFGRRRQVRNLAPLRLHFFHLLHVFHRILELLVLNLPLGVFLGLFIFACLRRRGWRSLLDFFDTFALADFLVLVDAVAGEFPSALIALL